MDSIGERFRNVAGNFTQVAIAVDPSDWDRPAPCDGWTARDVVGHLVEWVPPFLASGAAVDLPRGPSVDDDPTAAWSALSDGLQSILDDPDVGERTFSHPWAGTHALDDAIGMFILGDVLLHTWDLARATGGDERLDPAEVSAMYEGMLPHDEMLRQSGQYGSRVEVPADADVQSRLIAFVGRDPNWRPPT